MLFESTDKPLKPAEQLLALLLSERTDAHPCTLRYRKPTLQQIDGPSKKEAVTSAFDKLVSANLNGAPLLLYFTGHGSTSKERDLENNAYDLGPYNWMKLDADKRADYLVRALQIANGNYPWLIGATIFNLDFAAVPWNSINGAPYWFSLLNPGKTPRLAYTRIKDARHNGTLP